MGRNFWILIVFVCLACICGLVAQAHVESQDIPEMEIYKSNQRIAQKGEKEKSNGTKSYQCVYYDDNKRKTIKCQDLRECLYLTNYKFCDDKKLKEKIEIKEIDLDGSKATKEYEASYDTDLVSSEGFSCFCGAKFCTVDLLILRDDAFTNVLSISENYEILKTKTNGFYDIVETSRLSYNEFSESYLVWDGKEHYSPKKTKTIKIKEEKKKKKKK